MKWNKFNLIIFVLLILIASLYRVWDGRPWGFAPQIAMAIFGGAVIRDKKWAVALPLLSMFVSDALYQMLYSKGLTEIPGFYEGQFTNYVLFALLTLFGFLIRRRRANWKNILVVSLAAPTAYFIISNFLVWVGGGGYGRPHTLDGLLLCYNDGLPFYRGSLAGTLFFSVVLFGGYYLIRRYWLHRKQQLA
ncbi:MAG: hypothetical protein ICV51_06440 [Flavisolibacter sp.]|nr:hypothetical protein [Flavisolibacter sp.]